MLFSFIKILLFLTILGLSSAEGYDDSSSQDLDYTYSMNDDIDEKIEYEDIVNFDEQDRAVMKAVDEITHFKDDYTFADSVEIKNDESDFFSENIIRFDLINIIILALALLLCVSFIIIFIQASELQILKVF